MSASSVLEAFAGVPGKADIPIADKSVQTVDAEIFGKLCIHQSPWVGCEFWRVTHIGTGLAFPRFFEHRIAAALVARECDKVADWDEVAALLVRKRFHPAATFAKELCDALGGIE